MSRTEYRTPDGRLWVIEEGLIYGADAEVATWISNRLGGGSVQTLFVGIGALKEGTNPEDVTAENLPSVLVAGAYFFNHYDEELSDLSWVVAVDDFTIARPNVLRQVMRYPFRQLKVRRLTSEILLINERAVSQAKLMGFKLEGRKRRMGPGGTDVGIFGLVPEDFPFGIPA